MIGELRSLLSPRLHPPQTVTAWLEVATTDLTPAAAARVRAEYQTHLADTLAAESHLTQTEVLRRWGCAHRANRELRRAHLTDRDVRRLPPARLSLSGSLWPSAALLAGLMITALPDLRRGETTPVLLGTGALTALALLRRWVLSRPLPPTHRAAAYWLTDPASGALLASLGAALWFLHAGTLNPDRMRAWIHDPVSWVVLSLGAVHIGRLLLALNASRKPGAATA